MSPEMLTTLVNLILASNINCLEVERVQSGEAFSYKCVRHYDYTITYDAPTTTLGGGLLDCNDITKHKIRVDGINYCLSVDSDKHGEGAEECVKAPTAKDWN